MSKVKPNMIVGLEIECEVSPKFADKIGNHMYDWITDDWYVKNDCSLRSKKWKTKIPVSERYPWDDDIYEEGNNIFEIISRPVEYSEIGNLLNNFKSKIFNNERFDRSININDTCGNHIHVSFYNKNSKLIVEDTEDLGPDSIYCEGKEFFINAERFIPKVNKTNLNKIRSAVKKSLPKEAQKRYFRKYAKNIRAIKNLGLQKYMEWHRISKNHYEYRSFNLTGVTSWQQFINLYNKALKNIYKNLT